MDQPVIVASHFALHAEVRFNTREIWPEFTLVVKIIQRKSRLSPGLIVRLPTLDAVLLGWDIALIAQPRSTQRVDYRNCPFGPHAHA